MRLCAGCSSPVRQMSLAISRRDWATVEVCQECGGVYLDYFAGEPSTVARALDRLLLSAPEPVRLAHYQPVCRSCDLPMELIEYLQDDGPPLHRCSTCMAVFATPTQRQAMARFLPWTPPHSVLRRLWDAVFG
ncbi:MAG: hypothetical protein AAGC55_00005 [Myxococcota bacterium]